MLTGPANDNTATKFAVPLSVQTKGNDYLSRPLIFNVRTLTLFKLTYLKELRVKSSWLSGENSSPPKRHVPVQRHIMEWGRTRFKTDMCFVQSQRTAPSQRTGTATMEQDNQECHSSASYDSKRELGMEIGFTWSSIFPKI